MDRDVVLALISIAPELILIVAVVVTVLLLRDRIGQTLAGRVTSVTALGLRVELTPENVEHAVAARTSTAPVSAPRRSDGIRSEQIVQRATRLASNLDGRTVLWVDDEPAGNRLERRLLRQMGVFVEAVTTNDEAIELLRDPMESISLVITDIRRANGPSGLDLLHEIAKIQGAPGVVVYVGRVDTARPVPLGAFGVADRPDDLLNLVMDAIDRLPDRV